MSRARPVHTGVSDDLDVLLEGLSPVAGRRFLSVSAHGSGEAALTLVAAGAEEVLAFDLAAPEMLARLLGLKAHAAARLGREDYLVTMGLRPASKLRRRALAKQLVRALPPGQAQWWAKRRDWIEEGLFHADRITAFFRAFQGGVALLTPPNAEQQIFFDPESERRKQAFSRFVARPRVSRALGVVAQRVNLFFPKPEWRASAYPRELARDPLAYLEGLVEAGLMDSPLFAHAVRGRDAVMPEALLPPHLRTLRFDRLRSTAARARAIVHPEGVDNFAVPAAAGSMAGAYLSNAVDYLMPDERRALFREVRRVLSTGAPVLVYSNERWPKVPVELGFDLDEEASAKAQMSDRAHIYRRIEIYRATDPFRRGAGRLKVVG
jgi:S-adenosylmethionine:diacylglycerol 3-amino-3-carboxypropyl transferase